MREVVHHHKQVSFYLDYLYDFLMHLFFQSIPMLPLRLAVSYTVVYDFLKLNHHLPVDVNSPVYKDKV